MNYEFDPSGTLAMFIAAALQHPQPAINAQNPQCPPVSTIYVDQHKNKFNNVVVYCRLADPRLVQSAWTNEGNPGSPSEEYKRWCLIHDARHYREVYLQMLFLCPQYKDIILYRPDFRYLVFETVEELREWFHGYVSEDPSSNASAPNWVLEEWGVSTQKELWQTLLEVYSPTCSLPLSFRGKLNVIHRDVARPIAEKITKQVQLAAEKFSYVDAAYMRKDGRAFLMTGSESEAVAMREVVAFLEKLQKMFDPNAERFVFDGTYERGPFEGDPNWVCVYTKES